MGSCQSFCSRGMSVESAAWSDNKPMKRPTSSTNVTEETLIAKENSLDSDSDFNEPYPSEQEGNFEDTLFDEFREAVEQGNETMVMFYMEEYSSMDLLNTKYKNNDTVLHAAVKNQNYSTVQLLLKEGAEVGINKPNISNGDTPLHIASRNGDLKMVQLLLKHKANPKIKNHDDETAITIAHEHNFTNINTEFLVLSDFGSESKQQNLALLTPDIHTNLKAQHHARMRTSKVNHFVDDILWSTKSGHCGQSVTKMNTLKLMDIASDVFKDVLVTVKDSREHLPELEAWIHKKQAHAPYSWLKRWVVLKETYLLWSDRQISVDGKVDKTEKLRWNKCIHLKNIKVVSAVLHKSQKRFRVSLYKKDVIFKCKSTKMRDEWIAGMNKHIETVKLESIYVIEEVPLKK